MVFMFLGPSGSGKDTQAKIFADKYNYQVLSSGELLRREVESGSKLGKQIDADLKAGNWIDDDIVFQLLQRYLQATQAQNLILTGVVRRESQIDLLDETLNEFGLQLAKVINFELSDAEAVKRMGGRWYCPEDGALYNENDPQQSPKTSGICDKCGAQLQQREDDTPAAITNRLQQYRYNSQHILAEYDKRGILVRQNVDKDVGSIAADLQKALI